MAKVILILEDDFENNSLRISNNLADLDGKKTTAKVLANMIMDMLGQNFVSVCSYEAERQNNLNAKEE